MHYIKTIPGSAVFVKARSLPLDKLKIAKKEFETMVKLGIARPSDSSWAAPLHLTPKKLSDWRLCRDYRVLNAEIVPDKYPIPQTEYFAQSLTGKTFFSTTDLVHAYHQIKVHDDDLTRTAIITPFGLL